MFEKAVPWVRFRRVGRSGESGSWPRVIEAPDGGVGDYVRS